MTISTLFPEMTLLPVVVIDKAEDVVPLAEALLAGGITAIEITLRTSAGIRAIEQVAKQVPDIIVGSGTVTSAALLDDAINAGARFHVSPGITDTLAAHAAAKKVVWLGGVTNASQIMQAMEHGFTHVKFFPASLSGGVPMLKQFYSVFPTLQICPTGGIDTHNMHEYAALPNVFAIGGSWLTPKDKIAAKDWKVITEIAKASTSSLRKSS